MRQLPAEKYNIAWFKLAEFVARGEKERAVGLYRLLLHSFDDPALASQLEGDLLLSFDDDGAVQKYRDAAQLYHKQEKLIEVAAIYEHLTILEPANQDNLLELLGLYDSLGNHNRWNTTLTRWCHCLVQQADQEALFVAVHRFQEKNPDKRELVKKELLRLKPDGDFDSIL